MKIAVASVDGVSISEHFGRSACFIVFDVDGDKVGDAVIRTNTSSAHAKGQCCGHHDHGNHEGCHGEIVAALQDCSVMICGGMGGGMAQDLERNGIKPIIARDGCLPREAVQHYLAGTLQLGNANRHCHR